MTTTVAELLNEIIKHKIPVDHPVLTTPLSVFKKEDYSDVLTILWLFSEGWAEPVVKDKIKLGLVSAGQVGEFYIEVHTKVKDAVSAWEANAEQVKTLAIESTPKNTWVTSVQITQWLLDKPLFRILFPVKKPMQRNITTLQTLYDILGIVLPQNLHPDLAFILKLDIKRLELSDEELATLMYYTLLFIYGYASLDTSIFNCTYINENAVNNLGRTAQIRIDILLTHLDQNQTCVKNINSLLGKELKLNQCDLSPNILGLICFEKCPILKILYIQSWTAQQLDVEQIIQSPNVALFPYNNSFISGGILCSQKNNSHSVVDESVHDIILLVKLMSEEEVAKSQGLPFFSPSATKHQTTFEQLKGQIKSPELRKSINSQQLEAYKLILLINHQAISEFILQYGIQAQTQNIPSEEMLKDFLILFTPAKQQTNMQTIDKCAREKKLINLDNTEHLTDQITRVEELIKSLDQELTKHAESSQLRTDWLNAQKTIWSRLAVLLTEQYNQIEEIKMQSHFDQKMLS